MFRDGTLSRRDFLKLSSMSTMALVGAVIENSTQSRREGSLLDSLDQKVSYVHGVEIYGLKEPIDTADDFLALKSQIEQRWNDKFPIEAKNIPDYYKRGSILGKNTRILEVVVRQSDFENDPLSDDFVERMKHQVDIMNRVAIASEPSVDINTKIARIIVVNNSFSDHPAGLDYACDVDFSEFLGNEPRENSELWNYIVNSDKSLVVQRINSSKEKIGDNFFIPSKSDSFIPGDQGILSMYEFHELWHRLWQLKDLYPTEISKVDNDVFQFRFWSEKNGSWKVPELNPFDLALLQWNIKLGIRGYFDHPLSGAVSQENLTFVFAQRPSKINITCEGSQKIEIFPAIMHGGYYKNRNEGNRDKSLNPTPSQVSHTDNINLKNDLFMATKWVEPFTIVDEQPSRGREIDIIPTVYVIRAVKDGKTHEVHLPVAAFFLSKIQGGLDSARYSIKFTGSKLETVESLKVKFVHKSKIYSTISDIKINGGVIYAQMDIDGTDAQFIWFQEPPEELPTMPLMEGFSPVDLN